MLGRVFGLKVSKSCSFLLSPTVSIFDLSQKFLVIQKATPLITYDLAQGFIGGVRWCRVNFNFDHFKSSIYCACMKQL